jgi:hypothetical protein
MIPESEYRAAGYEPPFETLPTLDGVERAQETNATLSPDAHDDLSQRLRSAAQRREHLGGVGSGGRIIARKIGAKSPMPPSKVIHT